MSQANATGTVRTCLVPVTAVSCSPQTRPWLLGQAVPSGRPSVRRQADRARDATGSDGHGKNTRVNPIYRVLYLPNAGGGGAVWSFKTNDADIVGLGHPATQQRPPSTTTGRVAQDGSTSWATARGKGHTHTCQQRRASPPPPHSEPERRAINRNTATEKGTRRPQAKRATAWDRPLHPTPSPCSAGPFCRAGLCAVPEERRPPAAADLSTPRPNASESRAPPSAEALWQSSGHVVDRARSST